MRHIFFKIVRLFFNEIVCLAYKIYSEIKIAIILTVKEVILSILVNTTEQGCRKRPCSFIIP